LLNRNRPFIVSLFCAKDCEINAKIASEFGDANGELLIAKKRESDNEKNEILIAIGSNTANMSAPEDGKILKHSALIAVDIMH
jgi:hypothetical protein